MGSHLTRGLGLFAAAAGVAAAFAGSPYRSRAAAEVTALELAQWIRDRRPDLRVIDIRPRAAFEEFHIPTAEPLPAASQIGTSFQATDTVIIYADDGVGAAQVSASLQALGLARVFVLRGGLAAWSDDVMNPVIAADAPAAALSRYFGGVPRTVDGTADRSKSVKRPLKFGC